MKVYEVFGYTPERKEVDFDLQDDLMFFMNNDPEFYRKDYFPFLNKFKHHCDCGRSVSPKAFVPIVEKAYKNYLAKFPVQELDETLKENDLHDICEKLQHQELQNYHDEKDKQAEKRKEKENATSRTI